MAAPPGVNPLFANAPRTDLRMSWDTNVMAERHQAVWGWIVRQLDERNVDSFVIPGKTFRLLPQARGSYFIINVFGPDEVEPVPLVFNFHNLYLAGFQHGNRWYLFDDADLLGSGCELRQNEQYWRFLGFKGAYTEDVFSGLTVGIIELESAYQTLVRYPDYRVGRRSSVERACKRIMVMLCEAWRFPQWNALVRETLLKFGSCEVGSPENVVDFNGLFRSWSKLSERLLLGRDLFNTATPLPEFPEYDMMIPVIDVLLRPELDAEA